MRKILNSLGLWLKNDYSNPIAFDVSEYNTIEEKKIKVHKELLESLEKKEDERLSIIDTKTSQIITYTGIIFSALSLFIPILLSKIAEQNFVIRIIFIVILVFAFLFYTLAIHNAIRNYNMGNFPYSRSDPKNVIKYQDKSSNEFTSIEIRDLIYSYKQNSKSNDKKADNLIYAYRTFRIANVLTAIIGILICSSLLFAKTQENEMIIKNSVKIESLDSSIKEIINTIKSQKQQVAIDTTQH
ncbi:MAG: hypothetical protein QM725_09640 [Lacibacter sp.]